MLSRVFVFDLTYLCVQVLLSAACRVLLVYSAKMFAVRELVSCACVGGGVTPLMQPRCDVNDCINVNDDDDDDDDFAVADVSGAALTCECYREASAVSWLLIGVSVSQLNVHVLPRLLSL